MKPKQQPTIRIAREEDCQKIADIYNEYIRMGNATMDQTLKSADDIRGWMQNFNDRERLYTMLSEGKIIGWGIIKRYSDREGYRYTGETAIYLTGSVLGKGFGTTFKKYIIDACKELGYHHLVARIWASNAASIRYNTNLGYTIVGTQKEIGFRNGEWLDVVIMQLIL